MNENSRFSVATKLFFTSPYFLLIFLVIPSYLVLGIKLGLPVSGDLLLGNNVLFSLCVAARFVWYLQKMRRDIRYGADYRPPQSVLELDRPTSQLQSDLTGAGYRFDTAGRYGEKRDLGYLGTTVLYGGLLLLLLFGSYDYLREYFIMVRIGVGEPMSLDGKGLVGKIEAGDLAATSKLPLLQVKKQMLPNAQWPLGASEIALLTNDGQRKVLATGTIAPGKSFRYSGLDFEMSRFLFDCMIVIRSGDFLAYENFVKMLPLRQKKDAYSYAGSLQNSNFPNVKGAAWLNPEKKAVRVEAKLGEKKIIDAEMELWGKNKVTQGEYIASMEGLAQWTEIRVARGRHTLMLMIGAALVILGGLLRIVIRPQRVWLEEAGEGSRVRAVGSETKKLMSL